MAEQERDENGRFAGGGGGDKEAAIFAKAGNDPIHQGYKGRASELPSVKAANKNGAAAGALRAKEGATLSVQMAHEAAAESHAFAAKEARDHAKDKDAYAHHMARSKEHRSIARSVEQERKSKSLKNWAEKKTG